MFAKSKKQRKLANKAAQREKKLNHFVHQHTVVVPREEQTVDLGVGGEDAGERERGELKRALRGRRRQGIKEGNFLRGMK